MRCRQLPWMLTCIWARADRAWISIRRPRRRPRLRPALRGIARRPRLRMERWGTGRLLLRTGMWGTGRPRRTGQPATALLRRTIRTGIGLRRRMTGVPGIGPRRLTDAAFRRDTPNGAGVFPTPFFRIVLLAHAVEGKALCYGMKKRFAW